VKARLKPTAAAPRGSGKAVLTVRNAKGKMVVSGRNLTPNATFQVVVGGVPIGTFVTTKRGRGRTRFSTQPRGNDQALGTDPRGKHLAVHEMHDGEDELEGDMPGHDTNEVACCLPDDDGSECEDRDPDRCTNAGGTPQGPASSCSPNPCGGSAGGALVACCEREDDNDGDEAECELRTATACANRHGTVATGATTCDPNPCVPAGDAIRCCLPEDDQGGGHGHGSHGRHVETRDHGGDDDGDHGDGGDDNGLECEHLTHQHCIDAGGSDIGIGSCEGDPCASPSGAFLDPSTGGF
jgi:hypothetical protein